MSKRIAYFGCLLCVIILIIHFYPNFTHYVQNGLIFYQENHRNDVRMSKDTVDNRMSEVSAISAETKKYTWLRYPSMSKRKKIKKFDRTCSSDPEMTKWNFNCKKVCPLFNPPTEKTYEAVKLKCSKTISKLVSTNVMVSGNLTIHHVTNTSCLKKVISKFCHDGKLVPNIVHYIWFSKRKFNFFNFLSFLSASKFLKTCLIIIHGDVTPHGPYWKMLLRLIPNILFVPRQQQKSIFGKKLKLIEHRADIARIKVLQEYGGIYMDTDEVILRSLNPLRDYPITMSRAIDNNLSNGLILATKNATFLQIWLNEYKHFRSNEWGYSSTLVPFKLSKKYPKLIHVEDKTFVRPNYLQLKQLFNNNFDWSKNYAIHLYTRYYKKKHNVHDIRTLNTTIGSVSRYVIYGDKELCF